jgi:hypothetical protein
LAAIARVYRVSRLGQVGDESEREDGGDLRVDTDFDEPVPQRFLMRGKDKHVCIGLIAAHERLAEPGSPPRVVHERHCFELALKLRALGSQFR